jgi:hypothetical protein
VVECLERRIRRNRESEALAAPFVVDGDAQSVGRRVPEEHDVDAVAGTEVELNRVGGECVHASDDERLPGTTRYPFGGSWLDLGLKIQSSRRAAT